MSTTAPPVASADTAGVYRRHRPETTALYEIVRDNLETLYGAIDDEAIAVRIPKHARKELEGYLDCGLLCRGFARLRCGLCSENRIVAFSCKGRGFCPSCLGRRMCATGANLMERVLPPESSLRQWVLTFPFSWRRRLAGDGALLSRLTAIHYAGVLAAAHPWRPRITPPPPEQSFRAKARLRAREKASAGSYRPWAELLKRTFAVDALECPNCHGRMQPIAVLRERESIVRYLTAIGEATEVPPGSPKRGPPYWKSQVLRRQALGRPPPSSQHSGHDDPA